MSTVHKVMQLWRPGQYIKPHDAGPRIGHLFGAGEQGGVYLFDKAHQGGLFQDAAFTTPVTAVEQYVGSFLDWSGNANHCAQPTSTARGKWSARVNLFLNSASLSTQSVAVSAGSYRLILGGTGSVTLSGAATGTYGAGIHTITCTAGSLTCTVSGTVNDADIRPSASAYLPYQAVNTGTDYETAWFPHYLYFDGADDRYASTGSIDFTGTDKMTVIAGVAPEATTATANIVAIPNTGLNSFSLHSPNSTLTNHMLAVAGNTALQTCTSPFTSTEVVVLAARGDLAGVQRLSKNAGADVVNSGAVGGGTFKNTPIYIGANSSGIQLFKGQMHGLVIRGAESSEAELSFAKRFMANLQWRTL